MMDREELMEILAEEECLTADGFDSALVGCTYGANVVAVYDVDQMVAVLMEEGLEPSFSPSSRQRPTAKSLS